MQAIKSHDESTHHDEDDVEEYSDDDLLGDLTTELPSETFLKQLEEAMQGKALKSEEDSEYEAIGRGVCVCGVCVCWRTGTRMVNIKGVFQSLQRRRI